MAKTNKNPSDFGVADASVAYAAVPALQNAWTASAGFQAPQYARSGEGIVKLRGQATAGTLAAGTLLTTLPVGFRPGFKETFPIFSEVAAGAVTSLVVDTDGTIKIGTVAVTAAASISFSTVQFESAG